MTKVRCASCNFSFETKNDKKRVFCPNCGEREKIIKEKSAEDLVNDL